MPPRSRHCSEVVNLGPYALQPSYDQVWTGIKSLENGKETIFAYQASANDGEPNGNNANYGERLNFPHSGSPFGCCGFHQPSQNMMNTFVVDAATPSDRRHEPDDLERRKRRVRCGETAP